jgi:hypothetical protein
MKATGAFNDLPQELRDTVNGYRIKEEEPPTGDGIGSPEHLQHGHTAAGSLAGVEEV